MQVVVLNQYWQFSDKGQTLTGRVTHLTEVMCHLEILNAEDLSTTNNHRAILRHDLESTGILLINEHGADYQVDPPQYIREEY